MVKVLPPAAAVMTGAPPQLLTTFGVAAITRPAVSTSLKVRLVRAGEPAGLVRVKVRVELCPTPMVAGAKALSSDGSDCTVSELAVTLLVTRAAETMLALELVYGPPTVLEVTSTAIAHEACALFIGAAVPRIGPEPGARGTPAVSNGKGVGMLGTAAPKTLAGRLPVKL